MLLIGLPLTIVLGFLTALAVFPALDLFAAALLAVLLAPTDAALGAPVVTNPAVPAETREALNFESGLNDGICVPLVIILLDLALGTELGRGGVAHAILVIAEEIGLGLVTGVVLAAIAVRFLRLTTRRGWTSEHWLHVPVVALAALCFATAQALGGSGFIACFVGGLSFGYLSDRREELAGRGGEHRRGPGNADLDRVRRPDTGATAGLRDLACTALGFWGTIRHRPHPARGRNSFSVSKSW